jgi:hypothetical protein
VDKVGAGDTGEAALISAQPLARSSDYSLHGNEGHKNKCGDPDEGDGKVRVTHDANVSYGPRRRGPDLSLHPPSQ